MENQHRKITGYRELTQDEIDLMNRIKAIGQELDCLIAEVNTANANPEYRETNVASECYRWSSIAKTDLQTGLMALTRAVAKPEFF